MRVLGIREIEIAKMKLPGDFRKVVDSEEASLIAASVREFGVLLHDPWVRKSDSLLVFGTRRVASHVKLGKSRVLCKIVECSDDEVELVRYAENWHREHDGRKQREVEGKWLALLTKMEEAKPIEDPLERKAPKTRARESLAEKIGIRPESIRMREYREQLKNRAPRDKKIAPLSGMLMETFGLSLPDNFQKRVGEVHLRITDSAKRVALALAGITVLEESGLPISEVKLENVRQELKEASDKLRALLPYCVCPYCKANETVMAECAGCTKTGYITKTQAEGVPDELWKSDEPLVVFRGFKKKLSEFGFAREVKPPPPQEEEIELL